MQYPRQQWLIAKSEQLGASLCGRLLGREEAVEQSLPPPPEKEKKVREREKEIEAGFVNSEGMESLLPGATQWRCPPVGELWGHRAPSPEL